MVHILPTIFVIVQIFPGVGHNLRKIDKYRHKILLNFFRGCFQDEVKEPRTAGSQQLGLLEDLSSWLR